MKFTEILEELRKGKKVTREKWEKHGDSCAIDFILGFTRALINKEVQSAKLKNGLYKILMYMLFIIILIIIQWIFPNMLIWNIGGFNFSLSMMALLIIAFIEITSITENSKQIPMLYSLFCLIQSKIKEIIPISKTEEQSSDRD